MQDSRAREELPRSVELIPGKLRVEVFAHDVESGEERIPCWSFVTDGMVRFKQKEIILTVQRDLGSPPEEYPAELFLLFKSLQGCAEGGDIVDAGQSTLFSQAGFPGYEDIRGVGYVAPQGFPGVDTKGVPLLAAILLKGDEAEVAWSFGLTRVTSLLGMTYRRYPYPIWSDLKRAPVVSCAAMKESLLRDISRTYLQGSYYEEQSVIRLSIFPSGQNGIRRFLEELPPTSEVAFRTQPDPLANACLVWPSGKEQPLAITLPGSDGTRKTGNYLAFAPQMESMQIRMAEDGFCVFLPDNDWLKIREALFSGADLTIPRDGVTDASIEIRWLRGETYTRPVTGETYSAERWIRFEPEKPELRGEFVTIQSSRIVLLTTERDLSERVRVEDLASYTNKLTAIVDAFFAGAAEKAKCELSVQIELTVEGHLVRTAAIPQMNPVAAEELDKRLDAVFAPAVGGSVSLDLILGICTTNEV